MLRPVPSTYLGRGTHPESIVDGFRGEWPLMIMLREAVQNSIGAARKGEVIDFGIRVGLTAVPGDQIFHDGEILPKDSKHKGAADAYREVMKFLRDPKPLPFVEISDNGVGLGEDMEDPAECRWHNFMEAWGEGHHSQSAEEGAGGSKGQGKVSLALASIPRTFLAFTRFNSPEEAEARLLMQGMTIGCTVPREMGGFIDWGRTPDKAGGEVAFHVKQGALADRARISQVLRWFGVDLSELERTAWTGTRIFVISPWLGQESRQKWAPPAGKKVPGSWFGDLVPGSLAYLGRHEGRDGNLSRLTSLLREMLIWNFWNRLASSKPAVRISLCGFDSVDGSARKWTHGDLKTIAENTFLIGGFCSLWRAVEDGQSEGVKSVPILYKKKEYARMASKLRPYHPNALGELNQLTYQPEFLASEGGLGEAGAVMARFRRIGNLVNYQVLDHHREKGGADEKEIVLSVANFHGTDDGLQDSLLTCENTLHNEWDHKVLKGNEKIMVRSLLSEVEKAARSSLAPPLPGDPGGASAQSAGTRMLSQLLGFNTTGTKNKEPKPTGKSPKESLGVVQVSRGVDRLEVTVRPGKVPENGGSAAMNLAISLACASRGGGMRLGAGQVWSAKWAEGSGGDSLSVQDGEVMAAFPADGMERRIIITIPEMARPFAIDLQHSLGLSSAEVGS